MTAYDPMYFKAYRLPDQIDSTLAKLARLKVEADKIGLPVAELENADAFNRAWERAVETARLESGLD